MILFMKDQFADGMSAEGNTLYEIASGMAPDSKHFTMVCRVSWIVFGIVITFGRFPLCKREIPKFKKIGIPRCRPENRIPQVLGTPTWMAGVSRPKRNVVRTRVTKSPEFPQRTGRPGQQTPHHERYFGAEPIAQSAVDEHGDNAGQETKTPDPSGLNQIQT